VLNAYISQGRVATRLRYGGNYDKCFVAIDSQVQQWIICWSYERIFDWHVFFYSHCI